MTAALSKAIEAIDAYFRSGNQVPLERATIKAHEWAALKAAFHDAAKAGIEEPVAQEPVGYTSQNEIQQAKDGFGMFCEKSNAENSLPLYTVPSAPAGMVLVSEKAPKAMQELMLWATECRARGHKINPDAMWSKLNSVAWMLAAVQPEQGEKE